MKIIKYILEAIIIYFLFFLIKVIGLKFSRKIISLLFMSIGFLFKSNKITRKNIFYAFGNIQENKIKSILKSMWKNYAYTFVEYIYLHKYRFNKFSSPQIRVFGKEILDDLIKDKKQAIFISGHLANFELMAMELEKSKIDLAAIYRPLNNIFLNSFMVSLRKKYICKKQVEKGKSGAREIVELMKNNTSIALMVDQRLGESERFPFFGKPAHTTTLPAQLALKFNCDIIPIYLERKLDNTFNLEVLNPIKLNNLSAQERNKKEITLKINKILEKMILKNPQQWIWTHNRWK